MSNIPIFSYKDYLDKTVRLKDQGHVGADRQAEAPVSAGARGLRKTKAFIDEPVHMMGESEEGRPGPSNPNPNNMEENVLDVPTPTIPEIADKHGMSVQDILDQLRKGLKVEAEHTTDFETAKEIALDHLNELPDYYDRLDQAEKTAQDVKESELVVSKNDFPKIISSLITVPQTGVGKKEFDPRLLSKIYQALTGEPVDYDIAKGTYTVHKKPQTK